MRRAIRLSGHFLLFLAAVSLQTWAFADEANQAGLVVQLGDGQVVTRCIAFEEDEISGADLLSRSGLGVSLDPSSGMGITVCQIEDVGCAHPAEPCFCQCMGGGECSYWNYFYLDTGGTEWEYSPLGAGLRKVQPGSVEAWVWGDGHTPPAGALTFETVCTPPTPALTETPQLPTSIPATSTAAPAVTQVSTQPASALPTATTAPPTPTPSPSADTGQGLSSYWPFGLMVLALGLGGAWVWLRRAQ
jgi:hypothetical protein